MYDIGEEFSVEIDGEYEDFIALGEIEDQGETYLVAEDEYGEFYVFLEDEEGDLSMVDDEEVLETVFGLYESEDRLEMDTSNLWDDDSYEEEEEEEEYLEVFEEEE